MEVSETGTVDVPVAKDAAQGFETVPTAEVDDSDVVKFGSSIILHEGSDRYTFAKMVKKASAKVGKKYVKLACLVGAKYGSYFELRGNNLVQLARDPHQEDDADLSTKSHSVEASEKIPDNRALVDDNSAQQLSATEIAAMRTTAESGAEVVQKIAENSTTFNQKTEFAKAKYLRRKKKKFIITVQVLKPSARTLCEAYFAKMPHKIRQLRVDSLAEIMLHSDSHSGSQILTYDRCGGLVVGSLMERLAGKGTIVNVFPGPAPAVGIVDQFNFTADHKSVLHHIPISSLPNFPKKQTTASPVSAPAPAQDGTEMESAAKRRKLDENESVAVAPEVPGPAVRIGVTENAVASIVEKLRDADHPMFDSLVIVPEDGDDPQELLRLLFPFLAPSGSVVMFCPYSQPLAECYQDLMESHAVVHIRLFETWHRVYQVLPMRTHPLMQMHGSSGFLLTGFKVKSKYGTPVPTGFIPEAKPDAMEVDKS